MRRFVPQQMPRQRGRARTPHQWYPRRQGVRWGMVGETRRGRINRDKLNLEVEMQCQR